MQSLEHLIVIYSTNIIRLEGEDVSIMVTDILDKHQDHYADFLDFTLMIGKNHRKHEIALQSKEELMEITGSYMSKNNIERVQYVSNDELNKILEANDDVGKIQDEIANVGE